MHAAATIVAGPLVAETTAVEATLPEMATDLIPGAQKADMALAGLVTEIPVASAQAEAAQALDHLDQPEIDDETVAGLVTAAAQAMARSLRAALLSKTGWDE